MLFQCELDAVARIDLIGNQPPRFVQILGNVYDAFDFSERGQMSKINPLVNAGVSVVATAGNYGGGGNYNMAFPACLSNVVAVGRTRRACHGFLR